MVQHSEEAAGVMQCLILRKSLPTFQSFSRITKRHLSLAYTLHKPPKADHEGAHAPILILHGLFGSKQNNRSISKYATPTAVIAIIRPLTLDRSEHWHET